MNARVCLGNYAKNPYYFEKLGIYVYSMEELSYCLKENAFLLDREIMNDKLLHFIDGECDVPELARELYLLVHKKGSVSAFVTIILEYVGFYGREIIASVENVIKSGSGLSDFEKRKLRVDYLAEKKKYPEALEAYEELIADIQKKEASQSNKILSEVYYNKGVVLAALLLYGEAADCFMKAYQLNGDSSALQSFLFAKRMELPEKDYISLIAEMPDCYELSLLVEKKVEELEAKWEVSAKCAGLQNMKEWNEQGDKHRYYAEGEQLVEALKDEYRSCV